MLIKVRVKAGAKSDALKQVAPDRFDITTREEAAENRANLRVIQLLAAHLRIPAKKIRIIKGHHSPSKIAEVLE